MYIPIYLSLSIYIERERNTYIYIYIHTYIYIYIYRVSLAHHLASGAHRKRLYKHASLRL